MTALDHTHTLNTGFLPIILQQGNFQSTGQFWPTTGPILVHNAVCPKPHPPAYQLKCLVTSADGQDDGI